MEISKFDIEEMLSEYGMINYGETLEKASNSKKLKRIVNALIESPFQIERFS